MSEVKELFEGLERDKSACEKWRKKYELLDVKSRKQAEHYRQEISKLSRELEVENRSMLANGGMKSQKVQVEKLEEQIVKLQNELGQERDSVRKLENNEAGLKKEIKLLRESERDLKNDK